MKILEVFIDPVILTIIIKFIATWITFVYVWRSFVRFLIQQRLSPNARREQTWSKSGLTIVQIYITWRVMRIRIKVQFLTSFGLFALSSTKFQQQCSNVPTSSFTLLHFKKFIIFDSEKIGFSLNVRLRSLYFLIRRFNIHTTSSQRWNNVACVQSSVDNKKKLEIFIFVCSGALTLSTSKRNNFIHIQG